NEINDYLDRVPPEAAWLWADLGLSGDPWRPLRTDFSGDPLPSLLSPLEGLSPGNSLAAIHFVLRPAAGGSQAGGQACVSKLRGDNIAQGQSRPKVSSQDRDLIKRIEEKGRARGYDI